MALSSSELHEAVQFHRPEDRLQSPNHDGESNLKNLESFLRLLIKSFVSKLGYTLPETRDQSHFWEALHRRAVETRIPFPEGSYANKCFTVGGAYGYLCLPDHPLEVQLYVGLYNWIAILIDDNCGGSSAPEDFQRFHERFCNKERQPNPVLEAFAELLREAFVHWDPVVANSIVGASLNFVNACVLETRDEFLRMPRTCGGHSWPWWLRDRDGLAEAYAYFAFPKAMFPDISMFLEAIPDMSACIGLANDILSFYKEERSGESMKHNYVHSRAWYEDKSVETVIEDLVEETLACDRRMKIIMQGREPYGQALHNYVIGFVAFHELTSRYKLWEVGLGQKELE